MAADNPAHLPVLTGALNNLGVFYSELGRPADALASTEEAVSTYRALAADNPAFLSDLAQALNNLGVRYSQLGRRTDALPPTEEAVTTYRADALDDPNRFPTLLQDTARERPGAVEPLAKLALSAATNDAEAATAAVDLAVAASVAGNTARATEAVRAARRWDPDSVQAWITLLAGLGATHPAVLVLIPFLLEPPTMTNPESTDGEH